MTEKMSLGKLARNSCLSVLGWLAGCLCLCQTSETGDDRSWQMSLYKCGIYVSLSLFLLKMCDKQLWSIRLSRRQTAVSRLAAAAAAAKGGNKSGKGERANTFNIQQQHCQTADLLTRPGTLGTHTQLTADLSSLAPQNVVFATEC